MPITQTAHVRLAQIANNAINTIAELRQHARQLAVAATLAQGNSALAHITDPITHEAVQALANTLASLFHAISEIELNPTHIQEVAATLAHFKATSKHNQYVAEYQRRRRARANAPATANIPLATTTPPPLSAPPLDAPPHSAPHSAPLDQVCQDYLEGRITSLPTPPISPPASPAAQLFSERASIIADKAPTIAPPGSPPGPTLPLGSPPGP